MGDYIKRDKIGLSDFEIAMCNGDYKAGLKMLLDKINSIPAEDVEPVVYCADCAYCVKTDHYERWCHGFCNPPRLVAPDDFCSHGKRVE